MEHAKTRQLQVRQFREGDGEACISWDRAVVEYVFGAEWRDRIDTLRVDLNSDPHVQGNELPETSL